MGIAHGPLNATSPPFAYCACNRALVQLTSTPSATPVPWQGHGAPRPQRVTGGSCCPPPPPPPPRAPRHPPPCPPGPSAPQGHPHPHPHTHQSLCNTPAHPRIPAYPCKPPETPGPPATPPRPGLAPSERASGLHAQPAGWLPAGELRAPHHMGHTHGGARGGARHAAAV